jgi:hypothetical protein
MSMRKHQHLDFIVTDRMAHIIHTIGSKLSQTLPPFVPNQIPGLQVWLDGADPLNTGTAPSSGATVATWSDKSGNGYNAAGVNNPTYNLGGGINFNGTNQYYNTTYTACPATESIFVVYKANSLASLGALVDSTAEGGRQFGLYSAGAGPSLANNSIAWLLIGSYAITTGTTYIGECTYSPSGINLYVTGNTSASNSTNPGLKAGNTTIGAGFYTANGGITWFLNATVSEVLIYNTVLTTNQRQVVEGYLAWKWGVNSQLPGAHPFYGSRPVQSSLASTFLPTQISGLEMWLDGADPLGTGTAPSGGAAVATWSDKSGNGYNGTGVANPTYVAGGGISFNGSSQYYTTTYTAAPVQETAFVIAKFNSVTSQLVTIGNSGVTSSRTQFLNNNRMQISVYGIGGYGYGANDVSIGTTVMWDYTYSGGTITTYFNGNQDTITSSVPLYSGSGTTNIGFALSPYFMNGTIYEILIFNTFVNSQERQAIEGYLAWKWNLQSNLAVSHPYSTFPPNFSSLTNQFSPLQIPGLASWYDATDPLATGQQPATGTTISKWSDKSGNNRHLTQYSSYALPTYNQNAVNTLPTIDFTNASGLYTPTTSQKSSNVTMLMVCMPRSGLQSYSTFWGHYTTGAGHDNDIQLRNNGTQTLMTWHTNNQNSIGSTILMNSPTMYSCTMAGGTSMFMQQTNTLGTTSFTNTETLTWTAGLASQYVGIEDDGNRTNSYICEILYFQYVLTTAERRVLEGYLAWKWGLESYLPTSHPYYSYPPTNLSAPTSFSPIQFPGLNVWLDGRDPLGTGNAPANGTSITTWADKSRNGRSFTGSATYNSASTGLVFNGTTNFFTFSQMPLTYTGSVAYVVNITNAGAWDNFFQLGPVSAGVTFRVNGYTSTTVQINTVGGQDQIAQLPIYTNKLVIFYYTFTGTASTSTSLFIEEIGNGTLQTNTGTASRGITPGNQGAYIGTYGDGAGRMTGVVHEVLYYNTVLPTQSRQTIEGYLAWKWSVQDSLPPSHPFRYFAPTYNSLQSANSYVYKSSYLPGLQAWYDATDPFGTGVQPANASVISNWADKSGNSATMVARGSPTFTIGSQNSLPGITVSGNSGTTITNYFTAAIAPGTFFAEMDCFVVYKNTSAVTYNTLINRTTLNSFYSNPLEMWNTSWSFGSNNSYSTTSSYNLYNTNTSLFNVNVSQATTATSKVTAYTNGTAITLTGGTPTFTPSDGGTVLTLGSRGNADTGFNGLFYEVMVFNFPLSTDQREYVEGYLAWKWGLNASLPAAHPYFSAGPDINRLLFQPTQVVGLNLWLDGIDPLNTGVVPATSAVVSTWFDKSPNAINGTGAGNPTFVGGGGISFNGTNQSYTMSYAGLHYTETGFIVMKQAVNTTIQDILHGGPSTREIFSYNNGLFYLSDTGNVTQPIFPTTSINIFGYSLNTSATILYSNATQTASGAGASGLVAQTGIRLGAYCNAPGANWYNGNIYEVLIFNAVLTTNERQIVEGYLAWKWSLQRSLPATHPYYLAQPSLLTYVPSYTGLTNILSNADNYLPLKTNAIDIGTSPQTVTVNGTVSYSNVLGKSAIYFNNSLANYLSFPMSNVYGMTWAFWFNTPTGNFTMASFTRASLNPSVQFDVVNSTTLTIYTALPSYWSISPSVTFLGPNTWNFITVTINQNTFVETVYMNGSNAISANGSGPLGSTPDLFFLGRSGDPNRAYQGYIQNFMYFNTVLTGAQVNMLYEQTSTDLTVPIAPTALSLTFSSPTLSLSWTASLDTSSYLVQFYGLAASGTTGGTLLQQFSNVTTTSQNFTGTPTSNFCYARVTPINSGVVGITATSSAVAMPQAPPAPTNVTMGSFAAQQTTISASWTASAGATSYTVNFLSNAANSTSGGTVWQTITGVGGTSQASSTTLRAGSNGTYYYATVTAVNASGSSTAATSSGNIRYHIPLWVSGSIVWLDAGDSSTYTLSGTTLTSPGWMDKVASRYFLTNNGGASNVVAARGNPTLVNVSGYNAFFFNNSSSSPSAASIGVQTNLSSSPIVLPTQNATFFVVAQDLATNTSTQYRAVVQMTANQTSTRPHMYVTFHTTVYEGFAVLHDFNGSSWGRAIQNNLPGVSSAKRLMAGTSSQAFVSLHTNGTVTTSNATVYNSPYTNYNMYNLGLAVNNNGARVWGGYIHEVMIFNVALSVANRQIMEGYLAWKWGLQASLVAGHPYLSQAP